MVFGWISVFFRGFTPFLFGNNLTVMSYISIR